MANTQSIVDAVKGYLTPDIMQKLSSLTGESPGNTQRAMDSIIPTLLSGAANFAESPGGDNQLMKLISQQAADGNMLNNLSDKLGGGNATESLMRSGRDIVTALFGNKVSSVIETVASSLGMKTNTIASLLSIAAPLVLGALGKERSARGLGAGGLASLLTGQKGVLSKILPAGMGGLIGRGAVGRTEERAAQPFRYETPRASNESTRERRLDRWWLPVAVLAALGLLLYSFWPRQTTVPEGMIVKREVSSETPVRTESVPALQEPTPIAREPEPLPEQPKRQDATVGQSSKENVAGRSQIEGAWRELSRPVVSSGQDVRQAQAALKNHGQHPGPIDGIVGPQTRQALKQFQKANGLEQTGTLDEATIQRLAYAR